MGGSAPIREGVGHGSPRSGRGRRRRRASGPRPAAAWLAAPAPGRVRYGSNAPGEVDTVRVRQFGCPACGGLSGTGVPRAGPRASRRRAGGGV